jgi:hypothetical protein
MTSNNNTSSHKFYLYQAKHPYNIHGCLAFGWDYYRVKGDYWS